jgi:chloramphenicol 3-O-phosphotransferase
LSTLAKETSIQVLVAGYVLLIVGLAWLSLTRKSRRQSREEGYERGFAAGERAGYRRYAAEIDESMQAAKEIARRLGIGRVPSSSRE